MISAILWVCVGLFIGWVLLPEPAFVRDGWAKLLSFVRPTTPTQ